MVQLSASTSHYQTLSPLLWSRHRDDWLVVGDLDLFKVDAKLCLLFVGYTYCHSSRLRMKESLSGDCLQSSLSTSDEACLNPPLIGSWAGIKLVILDLFCPGES